MQKNLNINKKNTTHLRILTWNLGLFPWLKYAHYLNLKINGIKIQHQFFCPGHLELITKTITELAPDICVLQEFHDQNDRQLMISKLNQTYPFHCTFQNLYHQHNTLVFSRTSIIEKKLPLSEFHLLRSNNLTFIPIHLNAHHPSLRHNQIIQLITEIKKEQLSVDCLIGDTNFICFTKKNLFLFKKDKIAYAKLNELFNDATQKIGSTSKVLLNFDKIFIRKNLKYSNITCLVRTGKHMDHYPVFLDIKS